MILEQGHIYHIYNQGNNRQKIFFNRDNYQFFLKKIGEHILPFADILAWCLMPNHFHLMIYVVDSEGFTSSEALTSRTESEDFTTTDKTLNDSIGVLLRYYTRAVNIQQKRTGSLFREGTKAVELGSIESEKLKYQKRNANIAGIAQNLDEEQLQTCFGYIHKNPVKAGLAKQITDWEFSSACDITQIRKGSLINKKLIEELGLHL